MIRITVAQGTPRAITYTDKKGQPAKFYVQTVYLHTVDKDGNTPLYPEKAEIGLDRDDNGNPLFYAPGEYTLHPSSVFVDRNGRPALSVRLAPVKAKAAA